MTDRVVPQGAEGAKGNMPSLTRAVLDAAGRGDRDAFEIIVRTHFRLAHATAFSVVRDPVAAEDVVQDSFVRAWQRLGQCREPSAFAAWLRSLVRRVALNHIDREKVRATRHLGGLDLPSQVSPEQDLERSLLRDRLTAALDGLTDLQREILLLYDLEGFRHAEIAGLLGLSELMSRKHLSHARKRMRRALGVERPGRRRDEA